MHICSGENTKVEVKVDMYKTVGANMTMIDKMNDKSKLGLGFKPSHYVNCTIDSFVTLELRSCSKTKKVFTWNTIENIPNNVQGLSIKTMYLMWIGLIRD